MSDHQDHTAESGVSTPAGDHDALGFERLVFFSDAVFAIAITLLALELRLPESALESDAAVWAGLQEMGMPLLTYFISFAVLGVYWVGHHRRYRFVNRFDTRLLWLNLLFLMMIALVPFPTATLSASGGRTATVFYALTMSLVGFTHLLIWLYASHKGRLLRPDLTKAQVRWETVRLTAAPAVFLVSIPIAFLNNDLAKIVWLLLVPTSLILR